MKLELEKYWQYITHTKRNILLALWSILPEDNKHESFDIFEGLV